jgi:hypothetical protein
MGDFEFNKSSLNSKDVPVALPFPASVSVDPSVSIGETFKPANDSKDVKPVADQFNYESSTGKDISALGERYWGENLLGLRVFMPVKLGGIELPNPNISITGRMNIVETVIVGSDVEGTVKEEICTNDYDINIRMYAFDDSGLYPEQLVKSLVKLWKERKLLTIECVLTDFFLQAKDNCIITGINFPEQEASEDMQFIEFSLRSDREYELILE